MKKKLAWLLALVLLLAAVCAVAVAEEERVYSVTIGNTQSAKGAMHTSDKGITLRPSRGQTINAFIFGYYEYNNRDYFFPDTVSIQDGKFIDMASGEKIRNISFSCYGTPKIKVESGSSWLDAHISVNYDRATFSIWADENDYSEKQRIGSVVISDSKGVVLRIKITQSSDVEIESVKQLNGKKHDREVRVQTSRVQGVTGKVIYSASWPYDPDCTCVMCEYGDYEDCQYGNHYKCKPVKYTKGSIWYHKNRGVNKVHFYSVRVYRVIAGRKYIGDSSDYAYLRGVPWNTTLVTH